MRVISCNLHHDLSVLDAFNLLTNDGWELTSMYLSGKTAIIRFRKNGQSIVFEDASNRLRGSIKKWGELLNLPKMEIKDFNQASDEELLAYCKRDVEILMKMHLEFFKFIQEHDLGSEKSTLASQAFTAFRHRFMRHKILIHGNEEVIKLERAAYGGGRVSVFNVLPQIGVPIYHLDINSFYPFLMREFPYPYKLIKIIRPKNKSHLEKLLENFCLVGVFIIHPDVPAIRRKVKDKILYPCYPFIACLCTPEIKLALERNWILDIGEVAVYEKDYLFKEFVDYFYNLRRKYKEEGNAVFEEMCKIILNSLYGRFGIRKRLIIDITNEIDPVDGIDFIVGLHDRKLRGVYHIGDKLYTEIDFGESENSLVAVAAHVTAYGRCYLWHLIEQAGLNNVFYCDTDSLFVNEEGYQNIQHLVNASELGKLKLVGKATYAHFRARKDYIFGNNEKIKGLPYNSLQINENTYIREIWPKIRTMLGNPEKDYAIFYQLYHLSRLCFDGIPDKNGQVRPFKRPPAELDKEPLKLYL